MNNKRLKMTVVVIAAICILVVIGKVTCNLLLMAYISYKYGADLKGAGSIGIIGGADGPTSIYLTGSQGLYSTLIFVLLAVIAVGLALYYIRKSKR
ncbi:MAG: hypothetical protein AAGU76_12170 [Sedimentibacter sp.]|uniref:hypothetical protein n=1 Tax=Sedimentibacter sp. TaxID=1960295 RepID=UPI003158E141